MPPLRSSGCLGCHGRQVSRSATDDGIVVRDGTSLAFTSVVGNQVAMLVPSEGGWRSGGANP